MRGVGSSKKCEVREVSKGAGCGRFQKVRGAGGSKKCGVREVSKSVGCRSLKQARNLSQLLRPSLKLSQDELSSSLVRSHTDIHSFFFVDLEARWQ